MTTRWKYAVGYAVIPAVLIAFIVVLVNEYSASFWVGIGFVAFAYVTLLASEFPPDRRTDRVILSFTQSYVASVYFGITLLLNVVFIFFGSLSWRLALLPNSIVTGAFLLVAAATSIADKTTTDTAQTEADYRFVRTLTADLEALARSSEDQQTAKRIGKLAETARYAPVQSTASAGGIERRIQEHVRAAEQSLRHGNAGTLQHSLSEIESLLSTRSRLIKSDF